MHALAKKKLAFDIWQNREKPPALNFVICIFILALAVTGNFISAGNQIRIVWEYNLLAGYVGKMAWLAFLLQYTYYIFEMALVFLIIAFSQRGFDNVCKLKIIPWGGIAVGILWGLPHAIWKGSLSQGVLGLVKGIAFGIVYLLMKRNFRLVYPFMYLMFVL